MSETYYPSAFINVKRKQVEANVYNFVDKKEFGLLLT